MVFGHDDRNPYEFIWFWGCSIFYFYRNRLCCKCWTAPTERTAYSSKQLDAPISTWAWTMGFGSYRRVLRTCRMIIIIKYHWYYIIMIMIMSTVSIIIIIIMSIINCMSIIITISIVITIAVVIVIIVISVVRIVYCYC